jgi:hypothetical protein
MGFTEKSLDKFLKRITLLTMERFYALLDAIIDKLKPPFTHGRIVMEVKDGKVFRSEVTVGRLHNA